MFPVVIILVNYNQGLATQKCVESLLKSAYDDYSILVIDNGSTKEDRRYLESIQNEKIRILHTDSNKGYSAGVNLGLQNAQVMDPAYFLIMNNDTVISPEAITELVGASRRYNDRCIVSGKVYNMDAPDTLQYIGQRCRDFKMLDFPPYVKNRRELDVGQYDREMEMDMLDDIFWLLPRGVVEKVGFYSTRFFIYGEQNDYALRARKSGYKLIYTPNAKLWHIGALSSANGDRKSLRIIYWKFYAALQVAHDHLPRRYFVRFYVFDLLKTIFKFMLFTFMGRKNAELHGAKLNAYFYFTKGLFQKEKNNGYNPYH